MQRLGVRLIGGLDVPEASAADLGSRKQRRLLARLVLAGGAVVSTDVLTDDLWGDRLPANPRADLSVLVSRLRGVLPGGGPARRGDGYALEADSDVADLARCSAAAAEAAAAGSWPAAGVSARAALDLLSGRLLPELADVEWVRTEQARVDGLAQQSRLVLARAELAAGDPRSAVEVTRAAMTAEPYDEVALRLHLQACLAAHSPALGLAAYADARTRLADELGVDPDAETAALYSDLLRAASPHQRPARVEEGLPETQYATTSDGLYIAYQVTGSGPIDVLFNVGLLSHVEAAWDIAGKAQFFRRLASFCRLIRFDKRGSGLSDPVSGPVTLEQRTEDMRAVLDAVGSTRTALLGVSEGGAMSVLFAALYPERTSALVLYGMGARILRADDYPYGLTADEADVMLSGELSTWGDPSGSLLPLLAPSLSGDDAMRTAFARYERLAASPGQFAATMRMNMDLDVRAVLPTVQAPALVVHREGDLLFELGHARYLAENLPGARLVVLPGDDHMFWVDPEQITDEVEEFLVGARRSREPDRVLSTVLMTDIVGSTPRASSLGDAAWRDLLGDHDALVRRELAHFGGKELATTGDGFVASFDGPARAVRCAHSIAGLVRTLDLEVRAGIHTGECELRDGQLSGIALHIAARVSALASGGEVLVSSTVRDLVSGSGIAFADRGEHELRGIPDPWRLYSVTSV